MARRRREHDGARARAERRRQRLERRQAEVRQQAEEQWDGWEDVAEEYGEEVREALNNQADGIDKRWRRDKSKSWQSLRVEDLALMLFAMDQTQDFGLSYQRSKECFDRWGVTWHRQKESTMRRVVLELGLRVRAIRYSAGNHGDIFRRPTQN